MIKDQIANQAQWNVNSEIYAISLTNSRLNWFVRCAQMSIECDLNVKYLRTGGGETTHVEIFFLFQCKKFHS